jgi:acetolactate synthase-1/2/3 large subunit
MPIERRNFLAGALGAGPAVALAAALPARAAESETAAPPAAAAKGNLPPPPRDADPPKGRVQTVAYPGADFMIDVLKTLDFEYVVAVPGSSFRGLQEAVFSYGGNKSPQWVTALHEDSSIGMAHGYAKMSGKPVLNLVHGVVGLAHTPMAIYNAFCDQVPIVIIAGNTEDEGQRRPNADWQHSAHDQGIMVRDMTKWDDQPYSMQGFSESMVRAYDIATTVPRAPVLIVASGELMENELPPEDRKKLTIPKLKERNVPQGEMNAVREAAKWLVAAESPVIIADRYCRTPQGMAQLVQLAELLQAPVIDKGSRCNFPNRHPLSASLGGGATLRQADVVLCIEPTDIFGTLYDVPDIVDAKLVSRIKPGAKVINLGLGQTITKSNFNAFMRYAPADLVIEGDGEATLPWLIEAVGMEITPAIKTRLGMRGQKLSDNHARQFEAARKNAANGWDASPITTPRLSMELWDQIRNEDWAAGALSPGLSGWPTALWDFTKSYQHIGGQGGGGLGYSSPAAVGAALANKKNGRLNIAVVGDGDFNMAPGVMWTAAQQQLPMLLIVHNNGGYYQEFMHLERMAGQRSRGTDNGSWGCTFHHPDVAYAKLAQGYGCYAEGPISDPKELGPAIKRALAVVRKGEPALLDVVSQAR